MSQRAYCGRCAGCANGIESSKTRNEVKSCTKIENTPLKVIDKNFEKYLCWKINSSMWLVNKLNLKMDSHTRIDVSEVSAFSFLRVTIFH